MRQIAADADLAEGAAHLAAVCPVWARVLPDLGPLPLRRRADGFGALLDAVVSQQLSVASARAISGRLAAAGLDAPAPILAAGDDVLRACGLSAQKIRYLRGIAAAGIDYAALARAPDEAVIETLVALPGIGRWTAEIYLMFALGRADAFAPDDLALQEAARLLYGLPERPRGRALAALAEPWRPWRSVAARGLWAYYRLAKGREGTT
ncbi:DNA-3-methyladenine glycosylase family protein [Paracoccus sanguinis]|uniref:DNA-3-methyladenine glycosylase II n=1 Tax=Paracoccus sanguinis TaxID=1545044 RepID=A0A099G917_9RHOB|nr:DNA-3-methyladenine glycosylase [Paracoccus sanguinis]KGJ18668.1 3-methyladenine DNA glycosylase [Paracoccus sanguinis]KGJ23657.1 3-methyladenine DNA glycosylase [Paracoccus sanguinis]SDW24882.1 DNA-3-methyladenine glycosylase II [Paracoccus sanguinis]